MRVTEPPRLATWLLKRAGRHPNSESLAGDLIERYQNGRSAAWYWRQVLVAIGLGSLDEIRGHKWLAARAVLVGWTLLWGTRYFSRVLEMPGSALSVAAGNWLLTHDHESLRWWWFQTHASDLPVFVLWWMASACVGWVVAYTHRPRQSAMVLLFVTSVLVVRLPGIVVSLKQAVEFEGPPVLILAWMLNSVGSIVALVVAGLWSANPVDASDDPVALR